MSCQYNFTQFTVTGDCENNGSGGFTLYLETSSEPMSITWIEPNPWSPYDVLQLKRTFIMVLENI